MAKEPATTGAPSEAELARRLGQSKALWDELLAELARTGADGREWKLASKALGPSLRLLKGERRIVYLLPLEGAFQASLALGDRAVDAARAGALPKRGLELLAAARRYAEGTAVRVEVRTRADLALVKALAALKLAH